MSKKSVKPKNIQQPWALLALVFAVTMGGVYYHLYRNNSPEDRADPTQPKAATQAPMNWQKIPSEISIINTPITFQPLNKTFIHIPFKFSGDPPYTQLYFESKPTNTPNTFLVHHPFLASLSWQAVENDIVTLYQKKKQYKSIEQFLQNPPQAAILIDANLSQIPQYSHLKASILSETFNADEVDYVLTTYKPLQKNADGYVFERVIDASGAKISEKQAIGWNLYIPNTTAEQPYYLGTIHVDYRY